MSREKPQDIYIAKPNTFGNGAKLKAYKEHKNKEMVIITKELWDKIRKQKPVSEKEEKEISKWIVDNYEIN